MNNFVSFIVKITNIKNQNWCINFSSAKNIFKLFSRTVVDCLGCEVGEVLGVPGEIVALNRR